MEKIQHNNIKVNGINMHVAEIGEGPAVLFVHGFPELWYTWRHQMLFIASKGYRAIAPDLRGFGDTEAPPSATSYTAFHIVGDLVCLVDSLGLDKVYLVGHDWGAIISWYMCLFRPDRVKALVNMSVVYTPRNPLVKPLDQFRQIFGDDFYICRFQVMLFLNYKKMSFFFFNYLSRNMHIFQPTMYKYFLFFFKYNLFFLHHYLTTT
ncbi:putative soluble epoxide hydrolase [Helianthus annuus]|nr:putative soluble epoxide hydrolase [Helianthus annuus]